MQKLKNINVIGKIKASSTHPLPVTKVGVEESKALTLLTNQEKNSASVVLAKQKPNQTEEKLLSQVRSDLAYQIEIDVMHNKDFSKGFVRYNLLNPTKENLLVALKTVEQSMVPLPDDKMRENLFIMYNLQQRPNVTQEDLESKIKVTLSMCKEIPADLFIYQIGKLARHNSFWPTYAEIYAPIERDIEVRKNLHELLHLRTITLD